MSLFKNHITSTIFLGFYLVWWMFFIYCFKASGTEKSETCGTANGGLILLSFCLIVIYSLVLIIKTAFAKGQRRWHYLQFLGIVFLPAIYLLFFF